MTYELDIPDIPLEPQEWKLLFMMIAENRGKLDFRAELTPYGIDLLESVRRKLGINVVGVDSGESGPHSAPTFCPTCKQTLLYTATRELDELTKRSLWGDR